MVSGGGKTPVATSDAAEQRKRKKKMRIGNDLRKKGRVAK